MKARFVGWDDDCSSGDRVHSGAGLIIGEEPLSSSDIVGMAVGVERDPQAVRRSTIVIS
jgi:hypothetical protein